MALAHAIKDKVEAAYRRGDLFEKRRLMMEAWCNFLQVHRDNISILSLNEIAWGHFFNSVLAYPQS